jgi:hypothetical protein
MHAGPSRRRRIRCSTAGKPPPPAITVWARRCMGVPDGANELRKCKLCFCFCFLTDIGSQTVLSVLLSLKQPGPCSGSLATH